MIKKTSNISSKKSLISSIKDNFSALRHTNFRIFWFGQIISLTGSWMQTISLPWLTLTLTRSPFLLSLVTAMQFTPMLLFCLFSGVMVDSFDKKKIVIISQISLAVFAFILALLDLSGMVRYWHLLVIAFLIGCANSLDMPGRQSFMIEIVGKEDLMNAIALNSAIFNSARIIGPAAAGFLMGLIGTGYCFLINAISYIPVITGLFFIIPAFKYDTNNKIKNNIFKDILDGLKYIKSQKIILWTLLGVSAVGIFGMNFNVLVPVLVKFVMKIPEFSFINLIIKNPLFANVSLKKEEIGLGILMACMGFGAIFGAMTLASGHRKGPKTIIMLFTAVFSSIVLILIGLSTNFYITGFLLALSGFSNVSFFTTANTTLQLNSKHEFRGRVISVYTLLFGGVSPIGSLYSGIISDKINANAGFIACGIALFLFIAVLFIMNRLLLKKKL